MKKTLFQTNLFKSLTIYNGRNVGRFSESTKASKTETEDDSEAAESPVVFEDEDIELKEATIEKNRNKSRLLPQHWNMLNDTVPYQEAQSWIHDTVKYKRMMFGRYGLASGVDPRICFYSNNEVEAQKEYERVAFPYTIQQMMEVNAKSKIEKQERIQQREDGIDKKLAKLDTWIKELNERTAKKEADAKAAKARKERLIEEVRRQFGFKLDPRDERFQELLAQKEKEDKKKLKEERRKIKEEKMLARLQQRTEVNEEKPPE